MDQIIRWLTGYDPTGLQRIIDEQVDYKTFFARVPAFHPKSSLIKGVVCGHRVEEIQDPLMQRIRLLDKLIDELAKGRPMERFCESSSGSGLDALIASRWSFRTRKTEGARARMFSTPEQSKGFRRSRTLGSDTNRSPQRVGSWPVAMINGNSGRWAWISAATSSPGMSGSPKSTMEAVR